MSTSSTGAAAGQQSSGHSGKSGVVNWADYKPKVSPSEDALSVEECKEVWAKIEKYAGLFGISEDDKRSVRLATYAYFARNGTSRDGDYSRSIVLNNGKKLEAAAIKRAVGFYPRKFMRGCMEESYVALKSSGVMDEDERFCAKAASYGVSSDCAFAIADWFDECPYFTPKEKQAHEAAKNYGLTRARGARGGMSLEDVEKTRVAEGLHAGKAESSYADGPVTM